MHIVCHFIFILIVKFKNSHHHEIDHIRLSKKCMLVSKLDVNLYNNLVVTVLKNIKIDTVESRKYPFVLVYRISFLCII